nr:MAG TPA: hypothetical protein [Caudoviricetes sp.]
MTDVGYVQRRSLGLALVAAQTVGEGLALARSLGAEGAVFSQLEKTAPPRLVEEGVNPVGRHIIVVGADAVPALRVAARTWDRPLPPVLLVQQGVAVNDMVYQRCPSGLRAARAALLSVLLVRDGVARDLDTGEWWEREEDSGFVRTNTSDARRVMTGAVRKRIDAVSEAGGCPVLGSGTVDNDIVQYWSQVLQAPPAMCYEAIEGREVIR